jgi:hypothetical protein
MHTFKNGTQAPQNKDRTRITLPYMTKLKKTVRMVLVWDTVTLRWSITLSKKYANLGQLVANSRL